MSYNRASDLILDTAPKGVALAGVTTIGRALVIEPDTNALHLLFRVDVSAKTLAGNIALKLGGFMSEDIAVASLPGVLQTAGFIAETALPTGVALDATVVSWTLATAFPDIGSSVWAVKITHPPQHIVPVFTFTTGGGLIRVRIKAVY